MQSLEVISVNVWQILISLINLLILFLLIKKFLFKPVNNMLKNRQDELQKKYDEADEEKRIANENRLLWDEKMDSIKAESEKLIKNAEDSAKSRSDRIISDAEKEAEGIVRHAKTEAEYELKKAKSEIKNEIVEVSTALANKLLEREINVKDHKNLIDSFIEEIGDDNE